MNASFIKTPEKRKIIEKLNEQFGITDLPYLLIETGKEKIRGYSGSLSKDELMELGRLAKIEIVGIYLIRKEYDFRLSFDAPHLLKEQITKSIITITDEQYEKWIRGFDLEIPSEIKGTVVIKHGEDFVGSGKSNGQIIFNHIPKDRRVKSKL